ncbi:hypothetical protein [Streptomyces echinatus]
MYTRWTERAAYGNPERRNPIFLRPAGSVLAELLRPPGTPAGFPG